MKRLSISILTVLFAITFSNAQEIGFRLGGAYGNGYLAIDGIIPLDNDMRIHADMSFNSWGVGFDALWDVLYQPLQIESETFNWYLGAGGTTFIGRNVFSLGIIAEAGLEYHFDDAPIAVGIDWRPGFVFSSKSNFNVLNFGINGRWVF